MLINIFDTFSFISTQHNFICCVILSMQPIETRYFMENDSINLALVLISIIALIVPPLISLITTLANNNHLRLMQSDNFKMSEKAKNLNHLIEIYEAAIKTIPSFYYSQNTEHDDVDLISVYPYTDEIGKTAIYNLITESESDSVKNLCATILRILTDELNKISNQEK